MDRDRSRLWDVLDNPALWEASRVALDAGIGLYRRRVALLREWGLLDPPPSVIDVGCGIGQYATMTSNEYVGTDLNCRYVEWAQRRRGGPHRRFHCADAAELTADGRRFDLVVLVDFLHHLDDEQADGLLRTAGELAGGRVISFEPVADQRNRVGRWIVDHDRGNHMRPLARLEELYARAGLTAERSQDLMLGPIRTRAVLCSA